MRFQILRRLVSQHLFVPQLKVNQSSWHNRCWLSLRFITCRIFSITCWFYRLMTCGTTGLECFQGSPEVVYPRVNNFSLQIKRTHEKIVDHRNVYLREFWLLDARFGSFCLTLSWNSSCYIFTNSWWIKIGPKISSWWTLGTCQQLLLEIPWLINHSITLHPVNRFLNPKSSYERK